MLLPFFSFLFFLRQINQKICCFDIKYSYLYIHMPYVYMCTTFNDFSTVFCFYLHFCFSCFLCDFYILSFIFWGFDERYNEKFINIYADYCQYCLAVIFTKSFTCCSHIQYTNFAKIWAGFQWSHYSFSIICNYLQSSSIYYVHFFAHFTYYTIKQFQFQNKITNYNYIWFEYLSYKCSHQVKKEQALALKRVHKGIPLQYFGKSQRVLVYLNEHL